MEVQPLTKAEEKRIKQAAKLEAERARMWQMSAYEREYASFAPLCGVDEVGRGPLAGPVVAAAVILPEACEILYINDSKKLSEKKRELLFEEIQEKANAIGIGIVSPTQIDEMNILQATYEAMRTAVENLSIRPTILLNDAVTIPGIAIKQVPIVKGDMKSVSIAAASIIAKVTRDRMMTEYDAMFPEYGFERHKGYGTKVHIEALKKYGATPIHRQSFIGNIIRSNHGE